MLRRAVVGLALGAIACGGDGPTAPKQEVTLYFCGITWAAYRNEGEPWRALESTPQVATFKATDRLAIATVRQVGSGPSPWLEVYYLTADQAEATFTCGGPGSGPSPFRQLHGSVIGLASGATAWISMGRDLTYVTANLTPFDVRAPAAAPADLLATHEPFDDSPTSGRADKVIIRRAVDYADGATIPVLEFSSEAFAPQMNALTVDGVSGGPLTVYVGFRTGRGASGVINYDVQHAGNVVTTSSVPESRLATGDLHTVSVASSDRTLLYFYRAPANRSVAFGPAARTPVITIPGQTGELLRLEVASQAEYAEQVSVRFTPPQPAPSANTVVLTATKEYFGGTPGTWSLVLPDLRSAAGFLPSWGPATGGNAWTLTVTGLPRGLAPSSAGDGDIYRSASAFGTVTIAQ